MRRWVEISGRRAGQGLLLLAVAAWAGCNRSETTGLTPDAAEPVAVDGLEVPDDHDHAAHEMGPHGGHMVHLEPGGAHAEWVHLDSEEEIQVFVDEAIDAQSVAMQVTIAGQAEPKTYELKSAEDELGAGAFRLKSGELLVDIKMGEAATVQLVVETPQGTQQAAIEHHDH